MSAREFLCEAIDVVKVAVRLVLVLLIQLGIVEGLVIELGGILGLVNLRRLDVLGKGNYSGISGVTL